MERPSRRLVWVYADNLIKSLHATPRLEITRALRRAGWEVTLLSEGPDGVHVLQDVEVIGLSLPDVYLLGHIVFHLKVLKYLMQNWGKFDFVMFSYLSFPYMLLLKMRRLLSRNHRPLFVMDTRTVVMEARQSYTFRQRLRSTYLDWISKLANIFVDGQTAITRRMAEAVHISPAKLWGIWPSGVDLDQFISQRGNRCWPQGEEPVRIVYLGVFTPERNLMALCQAVEKVNQEGMHFVLSLIGEGKERANLEAFASQTGGRVQVTGPFPHNDVPVILTQMHLGALPFPDEPQFRVSSPIKLFEYMGAGMPILATRISCHTDVMGSQPCAFWAEDASVEGLSDALRKAWKDRASFAPMGQLAASLSEEFTWASSAKKLATALEYGATVAQGRGQPQMSKFSSE